MLRNVAVYLLLEIESSESDVARNKNVGCCTRSSLLIGVSVTGRSPFAILYLGENYTERSAYFVLNYEILLSL